MIDQWSKQIHDARVRLDRSGGAGVSASPERLEQYSAIADELSPAFEEPQGAEEKLGGQSETLAGSKTGLREERHRLRAPVDQGPRRLRERRRREVEFARRAADEASRAKTELIATVSHELRTPLTAISGYAELLAIGARGALTEEQIGDLRRIQQAQAHIMRLVDDLLSFAKLGSGHLRFDLGDVVVRDVLYDALSLIRPQT